jgi:hypothetical protein
MYIFILLLPSGRVVVRGAGKEREGQTARGKEGGEKNVNVYKCINIMHNVTLCTCMNAFVFYFLVKIIAVVRRYHTFNKRRSPSPTHVPLTVWGKDTAVCLKYRNL